MSVSLFKENLLVDRQPMQITQHRCDVVKHPSVGDRTSIGITTAATTTGNCAETFREFSGNFQQYTSQKLLSYLIAALRIRRGILFISFQLSCRLIDGFLM